ncbi:UNVERIFIED_CONTAM: hypothetical protein GTU68_047272 [Idotea baltica]|nr:hypothetical protein [Idotea baltica]
MQGFQEPPAELATHCAIYLKIPRSRGTES